MEQFEMLVPTYYGMMYAKMDPHENKEDFGEPNVPVLIHHAEGVRVVLGTHDAEDMAKPDIQIERRPNGWAIFLHPIGGSTSGLVYFLDDGRSYLVPDGLPNEEIRFVQFTEEVPLIDDPSIREVLPEPDVITEPSAEVVAPHDDIPPTGTARWNKVTAALAQAERALAGDSNDDEYEALVALVEALQASRAF